jgi:hypothetical protein
VRLPDPRLIDAYKTGFIYTQIIRSGDELKTGANGYDKEFSHDVIGILANLFIQGYTADAHGLAAQRSDGSLVVGCGVPEPWVRSGQVISLANFPTTDGRHTGLTIRTSGGSVTLTLTGDQPAGPVLFQLPAFVDDIAHASAGRSTRRQARSLWGPRSAPSPSS